jgi:hypothetical protein
VLKKALENRIAALGRPMSIETFRGMTVRPYLATNGQV